MHHRAFNDIFLGSLKWIIFINCHISVWHLNFEQMEKLFFIAPQPSFKLHFQHTCPSRNPYENIELLHTVSFISKIIKVWSSKKGLFHIYNTKASIHEFVNFNILALKRIAIMYRAGLWHLFSIKVNSFTDSFFIVEKELFVLCRIFSKEQVQFSNLFCSWICKQLQGEARFSPGHFTHGRFVQCPGLNIREIAIGPFGPTFYVICIDI